MRHRGQHGQAMVEMALGVGIFLIASMGAVQLGLSALASEGVQSATLMAARQASAALLAGHPNQRLIEGQAAALVGLGATRLGLMTPEGCGRTPSATCGLGAQCQRYRQGRAIPGTGRLCVEVTAGSGFGPVATDLDGPQDPNCRTRPCFGAAASMAPCSRPAAGGRVRVCLAYTSWPPRAVDVWISGTLRTVVPWPGGSGLNLWPVSSRLTLRVEALS